MKDPQTFGLNYFIWLKAVSEGMLTESLQE